MDGYALRSADTRAPTPAGPRASPWPATCPPAGWPSVLWVRARPSASSPARRCPTGADAVIPQEDVTVEGTVVRVSRPLDTRRLRAAARRGHATGRPTLRARPRALARRSRRARHGRAESRRGDPAARWWGFSPPGTRWRTWALPSGPGQIPNSNTYSLMAQVRSAGAEPLNLGVARDRQDEIEARLRLGAGRRPPHLLRGRLGGRARSRQGRAGRAGRRAASLARGHAAGQAHHLRHLPAPAKGTLPMFGLPGQSRSRPW